MGDLMRVLTMHDFQVPDELEKVEIPELGGYVFFKVLSWADAEKKDEDSTTDTSFKMLMACLCNEDGSPMFKSLEQLKKSKLKSLTSVTQAMVKFNGLGLEEAEKN